MNSSNIKNKKTFHETKRTCVLSVKGQIHQANNGSDHSN